MTRIVLTHTFASNRLRLTKILNMHPLISMAKDVPGKRPAKDKQLGDISLLTAILVAMLTNRFTKSTCNTTALMHSKSKLKTYPSNSMTGLQQRKYATMNGLKTARLSVKVVEQEKRLNRRFA